MASAPKSSRGNRYTPQQKRAIIEATRKARSDGKTWAQAYAVARRAGYSGTQAGLEALMSKQGHRKDPPGERTVPAPESRQAYERFVKRAVAERVGPTLARLSKELRRLAAELDALS